MVHTLEGQGTGHVVPPTQVQTVGRLVDLGMQKICPRVRSHAFATDLLAPVARWLRTFTLRGERFVVFVSHCTRREPGPVLNTLSFGRHMTFETTALAKSCAVFGQKSGIGVLVSSARWAVRPRAALGVRKAVGLRGDVCVKHKSRRHTHKQKDMSVNLAGLCRRFVVVRGPRVRCVPTRDIVVFASIIGGKSGAHIVSKPRYDQQG